MMEYALLNNSIVTNIIVIGRRSRNVFPYCVPINGLPVMIGDEYRDGKYYRNGQEITIGG